MNNLFYTGQRRCINHANFNRYEKGELHPDRILVEHDIFYLLEGSWEVGQDDVNYIVEQGDVVILHSGHHHYGTNYCLPGTRTMFVHYYPLLKDSFETNVNETALSEKMLSLPVVIKCRDSITVRSIFQDIILTFWSDLPDKNIKLAALLDILFFELAIISKKTTGVYDKLVNDALCHIRLSHEKIFTLTELSEILHVCSRSLTERFKKITGKTIHQYQIDLKLEMAYMLIKDYPDRPFKELAANFGFYDEFHFSKLFKKKYGIPPYELKKSLKL